MFLISSMEISMIEKEYSETSSRTLRLLRLKEVQRLTGLSRSYIYELCSKGDFPKSIPLVKGGSSVAWVEGEINQWIEDRIREARNSQH